MAVLTWDNAQAWSGSQTWDGLFAGGVSSITSAPLTSGTSITSAPLTVTTITGVPL